MEPRTGEAVADTKRVVVLVSGHGSNLQALLDAGMPVVLVAADRPDAYGLERARRAGVDTAVVRPADHPDRPAFDRALRDLVAAARPDAVCLAGFMRVLGVLVMGRGIELLSHSGPPGDITPRPSPSSHVRRRLRDVACRNFKGAGKPAQ